MREKLVKRFIEFSVQIHKLEKELNKTYSGRHVYGQLFRSGSSSGANYNEATAAESRADFIHKMQLSLKELRESYYWLRFIISSGLIDSSDQRIQLLLKENTEFLKIIGKAIVTAKRNKK
jgi:four helix bundle protein